MNTETSIAVSGDQKQQQPLNPVLRKALSLLILAIISILLGFLIDFIVYQFVGLTTAGTWYNVYWVAFFATCCFIAGSFYVFRGDLQIRPENLYLCIVLSMSCFSVYAFQINLVSWDVGIHYGFALQYSEPDREIDLSQADEDMVYFTSNRFATNSIQDLSDWEKELDEKASVETDAKVHGPLKDLYKSIGSLPALPILMALRASPVPYTIQYILGHLIYALIYSIVTFFGMRRLKSGKMLYGAVALFPTMIFLASNYSYDYWVNAFTLFGIAYLIGELQRRDEVVTRKNAILMLGAFLLGFGPKAVYFPLVLLCLLVPKSKFSSQKASRLFRAAAIAVALFAAASFVLPMLIGGAGTGDVRGGSEVNSSNQITYILQNPLTYAGTFFNYLYSYYLLPITSADFIVCFAYLGRSSWVFWGIALCVVLFLTLTDKGPDDRFVNTWPARIWTVLVIGACLVLVVTALYVTFTAVGSSVVAGCQPRYILPLVFPFLAFIGSHKLAWPRNAKGMTIRNACVFGIMAFVYMGSMWEVYVGHLM